MPKSSEIEGRKLTERQIACLQYLVEWKPSKMEAANGYPGTPSYQLDGRTAWSLVDRKLVETGFHRYLVGTQKRARTWFRITDAGRVALSARPRP